MNKELAVGEKGLVSIIMPTYNRGYIIQQAIDSVKNQTYKHWELIIVDDGSTDNTEIVVKKNAEENIHYISYLPNQGGNHARNVGMSVAKGEYVSFLDTDNVWVPEFLQDRIDAIQKEDVDFVFGRTKIIHPEYEMVFSDFAKEELSNIVSLRKNILKRNVIDTNVVCIKRQLLKEIGEFDENMKRFQDWEYFLRVVFSKNVKVLFRDNALCINYIQKDSIFNKGKVFWDSVAKIITKHREKYLSASKEIVKETVYNFLVNDYFASNVTQEAIVAFWGILEKFEDKEIYELVASALANQRTVINDQGEIIKQFRKAYNAQKRIALKNQEILDLTKKWFSNGSGKRELVWFLKSNKVKSVIIYGYGVLGRILYSELNDMQIEIKAIVDRGLKNESINFKNGLTEWKEDLSADAVIVTALSAYDGIKEMIRSKNENIKIFSMDKISS